MSGAVRDAGFDDWLDAIEEGDGYHLECENGHGSLPPRRACPHCGSQELVEVGLPSSGEVATFTVVHIPTPEFADDVPYATAVVDFGPVRLTGQVRGIDVDDVEVGMELRPGVDHSETTGERVLVFRPR